MGAGTDAGECFVAPVWRTAGADAAEAVQSYLCSEIGALVVASFLLRKCCRSDPGVDRPQRSKKSAIYERDSSEPFGTHRLLKEPLLFLRSCYIFFDGACALPFSSTWMPSLAESVKFSAECFCGPFQLVCPAFESTSLVFPSGEV